MKKEEILNKMDFFIDDNGLLIKVISIIILIISLTYLYYVLITMWGI